MNSARQAALSNNNIPESVYDNLVKTVNEHLPLLYRYLDLRKKVMGLDELHMYDIFTPLVKEVKMEVSYEEAKELYFKRSCSNGGRLYKRFKRRI